MPPNAKINIKLPLAPSNFILQKLVVAAPVLTVPCTSEIFSVRKQQGMSSVALAIEQLRGYWKYQGAGSAHNHESKTCCHRILVP